MQITTRVSHFVTSQLKHVVIKSSLPNNRPDEISNALPAAIFAEFTPPHVLSTLVNRNPHGGSERPTEDSAREG